MADGLPEERRLERSRADRHPEDFLELQTYIVSPLWVETIVEKERGKQADVEGEVGMELLDGLPGAEASFVGMGADPIGVELIEGGIGEQVGAAAASASLGSIHFGDG